MKHRIHTFDFFKAIKVITGCHINLETKLKNYFLVFAGKKVSPLTFFFLSLNRVA